MYASDAITYPLNSYEIVVLFLFFLNFFSSNKMYITHRYNKNEKPTLEGFDFALYALQYMKRVYKENGFNFQFLFLT